MPYIVTWWRREILCTKILNTLIKKICNQYRTLVFSTLRVVLFGILPKISRKDISNYIGLTLSIMEPKIVLKQCLSSIHLSRAKAFYILKLTQIVMISKNEDLILATFQIMMPDFKNFNNCRKYAIIDLYQVLAKIIFLI